MCLFGILILSSVILIFWMVRHSLPQNGIGGKISGLTSQVRIEQDEFGVPTLSGSSIEDLYRGQGWVTARDRLFQMDLLRRRSSGRLSEIFGKETRQFDTFHRQVGFSKVAADAFLKMPEKHRKLLEAYAEGVNAFIKQGPLPFEMQLLRYEPKPWSPEDSLLVVLAMFVDLDFASQYLSERSVTLLYQNRPKALADFLTPYGGFIDTPVRLDTVSPSRSLPGPGIDIRNELPLRPKEGAYEKSRRGSNAWALSGKYTQSGKPILAGDPHLDLFAPGIWYRIRLEGDSLKTTGVSLPGVPGIAIGSNDDLAWSITYPSVDNLDLIPVSDADVQSSSEEELKIKGEDPQKIPIKKTLWGPIIAHKNGKDLAIQWTALDSDALSQLDTVATMQARNTSEFLSALSSWKGPASNFVFATKSGDIGWVLAGLIPKRVGFDGRISTTRDKNRDWKGYLSFNEMPREINPPSGLVVSANQRMVPFTKGSNAVVYETGSNFSNPDRAFRIKNLLEKEKGKWTVESSAQIQLDIYSPTASFYRDILVNTQSPSKDDPWWNEISQIAREWNGRVSVDSPFPLIRAFRRQLIANLVEPLWGTPDLDEDWLKEDKSPVSEWYLVEPVVQSLLENKPLHLLAKQFHSYDEAVIAAALTSAKSLVKNPLDLKKLRWGDYNKTIVPHPFSMAFPDFLGKYFRMPIEESPGTFSTPRAAALLYGKFHSASMRMVVDLSDPTLATYNQPGGQSGNFQSPHYADQFQAWQKGISQKFQPGKSVILDTLTPH